MKRGLYHHGILGQRWGERNGPPYPLGADDHSVTEKRAGWRKSLDKGSERKYNKNDDGKEKSRLTEQQKQAIKIGAAAVTTALATYGAYQFYKSGKLDDFIEKGKSVLGLKNGETSEANLVGSILGKMGDKPVADFKTSEADVFKKLPKKETIEDVLKNANPTKSHNNCFNCVTATVARLCGLDVTARGDRADGKGISFDEICKVFKLNPDNNRDVIQIANPTVERIAKQITKRYTEGDVGAIGFSWNEAYKKLFGLSSTDNIGHTLNWVLKNGRAEFLDSQDGQNGEIIWKRLNAYLDSNHEVSLAKFGNVLKGINPETDLDRDLFHKFVK